MPLGVFFCDVPSLTRDEFENDISGSYSYRRSIDAVSCDVQPCSHHVSEDESDSIGIVAKNSSVCQTCRPAF